MVMVIVKEYTRAEHNPGGGGIYATLVKKVNKLVGLINS